MNRFLTDVAVFVVFVGVIFYLLYLTKTDSISAQEACKPYRELNHFHDKNRFIVVCEGNNNPSVKVIK